VLTDEHRFIDSAGVRQRLARIEPYPPF